MDGLGSLNQSRCSITQDIVRAVGLDLLFFKEYQRISGVEGFRGALIGRYGCKEDRRVDRFGGWVE